MDILNQLEKKIESVSFERANLLKENQNLQQKALRQTHDMEKVRSELSQGKQIGRDVKKRIDRLIEFLESLPILRE